MLKSQATEDEKQRVAARLRDALKAYFEDIRQIPLLTNEEELELGKRINKARENGGIDKETVNKLVKSNLRLVVRIAKSFTKRYSHLMPLWDLISEGNFGLFEAAEAFDYTKGKFSTYASWWIRQKIQRAVTDTGRMVRIPCQASEALSRIWKAIDELSLRNGQAPTFEEIADYTSIELRKVEELLSGRLLVGDYVSLDKPIGKDGEGEDKLYDILEIDEEKEDSFQKVSSESTRKKIEQVLSTLPLREQIVIRLRFGLDGGDKPLTLEETAEEVVDRYGGVFKTRLSRERIRQIQKNAVRRLKHPLRRRELENLLEKMD